MSIVIKVEDLSKAYQIGQFNTGTLSADIQRWWAIKRGKEDPFLKVGEVNDRDKKGIGDIVWSLRDINFEIEEGNAVAIIGKNGAGKSTLLKILSQVTSPTTGSLKVRGRIASLLEVGTGFHPELSGRENVFLNGAILGMRKQEIKRKFDEIVDFSGVERYIDTPVKRYSSGMYVRLAFAVAAYLESEILIVDEVLAVGDAEFQKKCLGKMGQVKQEQGRTVLFVSHNLRAVKQLCTSGILLQKGMIKTEGDILTVTEEYTNSEMSDKGFVPFVINSIGVAVTKFTINDDNKGVVLPYGKMQVDIELVADRDLEGVGVEIMLTKESVDGIVFATNTKTRKNLDIKIKKGVNRVSCIINSFNLSSGRYWIGFGIDKPFVEWYYYNKEVVNFEVGEVTIEPMLLPSIPGYGHFFMDHEWVI